MSEKIAAMLHADNVEEYVKYVLFSKDNHFYDEIQAIDSIVKLYNLKYSEPDFVNNQIIDDRILALSNSCLELEKYQEISRHDCINYITVSNKLEMIKLDNICMTEDIKYLSRVCNLEKGRIKSIAHKRFSFLVYQILQGKRSSEYLLSIYRLCPEGTKIQTKCLDAWREKFITELQSIKFIGTARDAYHNSKFDKVAHKAAYQNLCDLLRKEFEKTSNLRRLKDLYFQAPDNSKVKLQIFAKILDVANTIKLMNGLINSFGFSSHELHIASIKLDNMCLDKIKKTDDIKIISNTFYFAPAGYEARPYAIKKIHRLLQNQTPAR